MILPLVITLMGAWLTALSILMWGVLRDLDQVVETTRMMPQQMNHMRETANKMHEQMAQLEQTCDNKNATSEEDILRIVENRIDELKRKKQQQRRKKKEKDS